MRQTVVILIVCMSSVCFAQSKYTDVMYRKALTRQSTAPLYLLFTLNDDKTGQDRVVCTVAPFLLGAIQIQYHLNYDKGGEEVALVIALHNPGHRFRFNNPKALKNIVGDTPEKLAEARKYLEGMSDAQVRQSIANQSLDRWCERRPIKEWHGCQAAIAHVLLERGMLVGHGDYVAKLYLEK